LFSIILSLWNLKFFLPFGSAPPPNIRRRVLKPTRRRMKMPNEENQDQKRKDQNSSQNETPGKQKQDPNKNMDKDESWRNK
jgi:hypothetical protein